MPTKRKVLKPDPAASHNPKLKAALDELRLRCIEDKWLGWCTPHVFACERGHRFSTYPANMLKRRQPCAVCDAQARLEALQDCCNKAGVTCLDRSWKGADAKHRFRCRQGHLWQRRGGSALGNPRCPHCTQAVTRRNRLLTDGMTRLHATAQAQGGSCMSDQYLGSAGRHLFRCAHRHEWWATAQDVLRGTWCLRCANDRKRSAYLLPDGLAQLQKAAGAKGGECLSEAYLGANVRYRFQCTKGHAWDAPGARILRGGWCHACSYDAKRLSIDVARQEARERGGSCLSLVYMNAAAKLTWECHRGHVWSAALGTIRQGHWCPECAHAAKISNRRSTKRSRYGSSPRHRSAVRAE